MFSSHSPLKASWCFVHFLSLMINVILHFWHKKTFCVCKLYIVVLCYKFQQHEQKLGKYTEHCFAVSWNQIVTRVLWGTRDEIIWNWLTVLQSIYCWNQTWYYRYHQVESATAKGKWRQDEVRIVKALRKKRKKKKKSM